MATKSVKFIASACIVAIAAITAYWYWSPFLVMRQMRNAAINKDADAFNARVDYPSLRESLKGQFSAMVMDQMSKSSQKENGFAALGNMLALTMANQLIEAMVRPEVMMKVIQDGKFSPSGKQGAQESNAGTSASQANEQKLDTPDWTFKRVDADRLIAYAGNATGTEPKSADKLGMVFVRHGFADWKLTEIRLALAE